MVRGREGRAVLTEVLRGRAGDCQSRRLPLPFASGDGHGGVACVPPVEFGNVRGIESARFEVGEVAQGGKEVHAALGLRGVNML